MFIKRITFDGYSTSALELSELHDGKKYETPNMFMTVFSFVDEGGQYGTNNSIVNGYTMRITITTATITMIQLYGEENAKEARDYRMKGNPPFFSELIP